jgi:toxin ParE1/3/4
MAESRPEFYRLRPHAVEDLETIWLYTAMQWSIDQAELYIRELTAGLDFLVAHPETARERVELSPPVRIHCIAAHLVVYRIEPDYLDIIRIRHRREDWMSDPLGE